MITTRSGSVIPHPNLFADFIFGFQQPDIIAFGAHLQCGIQDHHRIFQLADLQQYIDKLVREQQIIIIGKACLGFYGAGGGIYLVIRVSSLP